MPTPLSSYYRATVVDAPVYTALEGKRETSVCVIGGGFAGLNTALGLAERGMVGVTVLESENIGFGASGRNGGFVFAGFSRGEEALLGELGPQRAKALYTGTRNAVETIRRRASHYHIDCDVTEAGVIWANWFHDPEMLRSRQRLLEEHYDAHWQWLPQAEVRRRIRSDRYHDALFETQGFHFHPLKYAHGVARAAADQGVAIFEQTPAIGLERQGDAWRIRTPSGEIHAQHVVLACGGYLARLLRRVDAGVLPIATYVVVTEPLGERMRDVLTTGAAVYDTRFAFDYYRPLPDTRLLWGGRISILDRSPLAVERLLYRDLMKVFPQLEGTIIDYAWSGLMSYARHQMPQIGRIDDGLWLAQAFGGHGVAPTTFAGEVLAAAIAEDDERWRDFSDYGLVSAMKPAGFIGAQLGYWWAEFKDAWKDRMERRSDA